MNAFDFFYSGGGPVAAAAAAASVLSSDPMTISAAMAHAANVVRLAPCPLPYLVAFFKSQLRYKPVRLDGFSPHKSVLIL